MGHGALDFTALAFPAGDTILHLAVKLGGKAGMTLLQVGWLVGWVVGIFESHLPCMHVVRLCVGAGAGRVCVHESREWIHRSERATDLAPLLLATSAQMLVNLKRQCDSSRRFAGFMSHLPIEQANGQGATPLTLAIKSGSIQVGR